MGSIDFKYTGKVQEFIAPKTGSYTLECWGAQGGSYSTSYLGGLGGYSKGTINLTKGTKLFIYVGGQPDTNTSTSASSSYKVEGGFNGGGSSKTYSYSGTTTIGQGGGGATDIRIGTNSFYARVIVAGGGAGSTSRSDCSSYCGGGITSGAYNSTYQATQTSAGSKGSFGQGANATGSYNYKYGAGGGGGGWYGGGVNTSVSDSDTTRCSQVGGGSGYVYTSSTKSSYPSGCLLNDSHLLTDAQTIAGNSSMPNKNNTNTTVTGNSGHGMVRITQIKTNPPVYVKIDGQWRKGIAYVKVNGTWKEATGINVKANGTWKADGNEPNIPTTCPTMVSGSTYTLVNFEDDCEIMDSYKDEAKTITLTIPTLPNIVKQVESASFTFTVSTDDNFGELYTYTRVVRNGATVYTIHSGKIGLYGSFGGIFT